MFVDLLYIYIYINFIFQFSGWMMYVEREKGLERVVSVAELLTVCSDSVVKQLGGSGSKGGASLL